MSTKAPTSTEYAAPSSAAAAVAHYESAARRHRWLGRLGRITGYVILIGLTISSIAPLVWLALTSIRPRNDVFAGTLLPSALTLEAYQFILTELGIEIFFLNSLRITLITVTAVVVLATMAGYAFARINFWGRHILFLVLLSTLMVPGPVLIIPLFLQLGELGLIDTQRGLILAYIGGSLPFAMFLMRSFFETLPAELVDAGRIDGASEFGIFWRIMTPLARPGIATIVIFQFRDTWNEFIFAATLIHTPELRPLQPAIFALVGRYSTNWPALAAGLIVSAVPIVLIYVFMQKQFVSGLTTGAIKG
jgi:ABC-type glycerol-3-phosphate transport system permease component